MKQQLEKVRQEVDRLLSQHLADWSHAVASQTADAAADLSPYVEIAAQLCTARQALEAARVARLAVRDEPVESGVDMGEAFVEEDTTVLDEETVSRRVRTTIEDVYEVDADSSGRKRDDRGRK